jgi:hypothetical protein
MQLSTIAAIAVISSRRRFGPKAIDREGPLCASFQTLLFWLSPDQAVPTLGGDRRLKKRVPKSLLRDFGARHPAGAC